MSTIRNAFVCYPIFKKKTSTFYSVSGTCVYRISTKVERPSGSSTPGSSEVRRKNERSTPKRVRGKQYSRSIWNIATRIGEARDKFQKVSAEVNALKSSPEGFVLGSDLSQFSIGSSSLVQDLEAPAAPRYWGLAPEAVLELVAIYMSRQDIPEYERRMYIERLRNVLAALRGWTHSFADQARPLLESNASEQDDADKLRSLDPFDAFVTLLQMAGFAVLPEIADLNDPPCPEALPLGNSIEETLDPTLVQESAAVRTHIKSNGVHIGSPSYYPHLFIATRGISLVRKSGLLVPQKIRAIERSYFSWIRTPFALLIEPVRGVASSVWNVFISTRRESEVANGRAARTIEEGIALPEAADSIDASKQSEGRRVRRVVPAVQLEGGLGSLSGLFLPTFTQEPAAELMVLLYREVDVELNRESMRKEARMALMKQIRNSIAQAVNPIPSSRRALQIAGSETEASVFDRFKRPLGTVKPVTLQMFADVQWGTIAHFFPSTFVLPATTDLLRIDIVTFVGLVSTFVTYAKNSESIFISALLAGSIISYSLRVAFGWRTALINYRGQIARDRASAIFSRQQSTLDSLASMSAEELFPDLCCVWLSNALRNGPSAQDLQREAFGEVSLTDETVKTWDEWLEGHSSVGV